MRHRVLALAGMAASLASFAGTAVAAESLPRPLSQQATVQDGAPAIKEIPKQSLDEPAISRLLPSSVTVNGSAVGNWVLLERNGHLFATADALEEWRLNSLPGVVPLRYRGQAWFPLDEVPGFRFQMNATEQSVAMTFAPQAFAATRLTQRRAERPELTPAIPVAFANYDVSYTRTSLRGGPAFSDLGALAEFGVSGNWGLLSSSFVANGLNNPDDRRAVRRLETAYSRDFLGPDVTLRIGDSSTRPTSWGRSVYFGGLQLGRNFGLRPGFISQPVPVLNGTSIAPSTLELYINDALRQTSNVPAGPFVVDNLPQLTGTGQARIVVRDLLGRETVVIQDLFSHASLLEQGLSDWSLELGKVRSDLGIKSAEYGQPFGSVLWRQGLSKTMTVETHAEAGSKTRGAGVGLAAAAPLGMLGQLAFAGSQSDAVGAGHVWQASLSRTGLLHSFTFNWQSASSTFRQIGQDDASWAYQRQLSASYNFNAGPLGLLGAGYGRIDTAAGQSIGTSTLNYTVPLGQASSLTVNLVHVKEGLSGGGTTAMSVSLFIPLEGRVQTSTSFTFKGSKVDAYTSAIRGLPGETGWGWRALGGYTDDRPRAEGGVFFQSLKTMATADLSASSSQQTLRLGLQGALVAADGEIFATRRVPQSFALVEVPGYADIGVNVFGGIVARTDPQGRALVPRLMPYQENRIRLDPTELPISAELDTIEQVAVPASRTAVKVVFPVRSGRAALIKLLFDDGEPAPAGAEIELVGDKHEFFVARRGEAFITGLQDGTNRIRLKHNAQSCAVDVRMPPLAGDEIVRLGPLTCSGVKR